MPRTFLVRYTRDNNVLTFFSLCRWDPRGTYAVTECQVAVPSSRGENIPSRSIRRRRASARTPTWHLVSSTQDMKNSGQRRAAEASPWLTSMMKCVSQACDGSKMFDTNVCHAVSMAATSLFKRLKFVKPSVVIACEYRSTLCLPVIGGVIERVSERLNHITRLLMRAGIAELWYFRYRASYDIRDHTLWRASCSCSRESRPLFLLTPSLLPGPLVRCFTL